MATVFVDSEFKCHATNPDGAFREITHPFFDNKCATVIEGYCCDDSKGYLQIYPWKDYNELDAAQRQYDREILADAEKALAILLGGVSE